MIECRTSCYWSQPSHVRRSVHPARRLFGTLVGSICCAPTLITNSTRSLSRAISRRSGPLTDTVCYDSLPVIADPFERSPVKRYNDPYESPCKKIDKYDLATVEFLVDDAAVVPFHVVHTPFNCNLVCYHGIILYIENLLAEGRGLPSNIYSDEKVLDV